MSSYDSRVQLTSKSSVIYKFLVHADSPQGARVKVQNHLRKLGDFDFSEILHFVYGGEGGCLASKP
ncbi:Uncharacterised protein [Klebsiella pneumoniae]|nr:Uncharacterised protein [Klebsiella pneumoniae]